MKTEQKFTPGPWGIHPIKTKGRVTHYGINGVSESGDRLTSGRIVDVPANVPNHSADIQEANARLIAAAPELLEAVKQAQHALASFKGQCDKREWREDWPFLPGALAALNTALAKATQP